MQAVHTDVSIEEMSKEQRVFLEAVSRQMHFFELLNGIDNAAIFFKNTQGDIMFGNQLLMKSLGLAKPSDVLSHTDEDFFPAYLVEKYQRDDQEVIAKRTAKTFIVELFKNEQGILGWFVTHKYPIFDKDQVIGVMGSIQEYKTMAACAQNADEGILQSSQFIQTHFQQAITITELSTMSELPVRQFQRKFKRIFSVSPQEYIIRHRLHYACEALRNTQTQISKVAVDAGFYDQSSFTRQFKKYMYTTPLKYRRALG